MDRQSPMAALYRLTKQQQAQKLRLLLSKIHVKQARGVALTPTEENLLGECYYRYYSKPREKRHVTPEGVITVERTVDVEPVIDAMRDYADTISFGRHRHNARLVGSIDPIIAEQWAKETGLRIGSKEFVQFAAKRLRSDIDFRKFRAGH